MTRNQEENPYLIRLFWAMLNEKIEYNNSSGIYPAYKQLNTIEESLSFGKDYLVDFYKGKFGDVINVNRFSLILKTYLNYDDWSSFRKQESINSHFESYFTGDDRHKVLIDNAVKQRLKKNRSDEENEDSLSTYYTYLASFYTSKVLGEDELTLKDLYIEPRFTHTRNETIFSFGGNQQNHKIGSLLPEICNWIQKIPTYLAKEETEQPNYKMKLVMGYAGQGKTSFCYRLMYDLLNDNNFDKPIFFFRLRDIDSYLIKDFLQNPYEVIISLIKNKGFSDIHTQTKCKIEFEDEYFTNSILILDGLDELSNIYNIDKNQLCLTFLNNFKYYLCPFRLIVTSRYELDSHFLSNNGINIFKIDEFTIGEQKKWIANYNSKVTEEKQYLLNSEMLERFNERESVKPLVSQPIMLHILAQLQLQDLEHFNASQIYNLLFDRLIDRYWTNKQYEDSLHPLLLFKDKTQIRRLLQSIGFEMMKQSNPILNHKSLKSIFENNGINDLDTFNAKTFKQLLIGFYFKETDERANIDNYSIEFLHKTFGEYLAAEYIWKKLNSRKELNDDSIIKLQHGYTMVELSHLFTDLFGNILLPEKVIDYLIDIIENANETEIESVYSKLHISRPIFSILTNQSFITLKNVLYGFINIYSRVTNNTKEISSGIDNETLFILIETLVNTKTFHDIYFKKISLEGMTFQGVHWKYINLEGSNLKSINLERANLSKANLSFSMSGKSHDFKQRTNLEGAILKRADFIDSNLTEANLMNSDLRLVNLKGANLKGANLRLANFGGTVLGNADLSFTQLHNAKSLTVKQLSKAKTLYNCEGLPTEIEKELREKFSYLFDKNTIKPIEHY
ncbi:hypothetical protein GCM10027035_16750 [Emticicia sediminis]